MSKNYQLVYQSRRKCEIYRDTDVSKNKHKVREPRSHNGLAMLNKIQ